MCWCFPFGALAPIKRKPPPAEERKRRRERYPTDPLRGDGVAVVEEVQEKRKSTSSRSERSEKKSPPRSPRSRTSQQSTRREREDRRPRQEYRYYQDSSRTRESSTRPALNVQVPEMWYRTAEPGDGNSSTEMLLNPRPHRSPHERQRHPRRTSQSTLRGRGAKRDPPRKPKSKKNLRQEAPIWSLFSPPPPKQPRRERHYQTMETSPRSHRSTRQHPPAHEYQPIPEPAAPHRHRSSRQHQSAHHSSQHARAHSRSRTPNTAARREPDRRFAMRAATNQALEELRREAFAHPSPPPRRQRVRRYQGVTIPTSTIPFNWDCVSSEQSAVTPADDIYVR
jgi:hypothetical protein